MTHLSFSYRLDAFQRISTKSSTKQLTFRRLVAIAIAITNCYHVTRAKCVHGVLSVPVPVPVSVSVPVLGTSPGVPRILTLVCRHLSSPRLRRVCLFKLHRWVIVRWRNACSHLVLIGVSLSDKSRVYEVGGAG